VQFNGCCFKSITAEAFGATEDKSGNPDFGMRNMSGGRFAEDAGSPESCLFSIHEIQKGWQKMGAEK
jgi:hypothetical protein